MPNYPDKYADTTTNRTARAILDRLARRGPSTLAEIALGDGIPGSGTVAFAEAFAVLTRNVYVRWAADVRRGGRNNPVPSFEATLAGHEVADIIESAVYS